METTEHILAIIASILLISKFSSSLSIKLKQPPVLGMLLIGLILGPSGFHLINSDHTIQFFAKIGVIFLLFMAGLETDISSMKKTGKSSFLVAITGVLLPFSAGLALGIVFFPDNIFRTLVIATIFTATSVSVSVMTLMDMKKLRSVEGSTILGAAVIDDIIAIILLTFVFGFSNPMANLSFTFLKMAGFLAGALLFGFFLINPLIQFARKLKAQQTILAVAIALCFFYSWAAEIVEIAPITGAYLAGLFLGRTNARHSISEGIETVGQSIFVSIFFMNIGLETHLWGAQLPILFSLLFVFAAVFSKFIGAGIGARFSGFTWPRALPIGIGMVPRGEVALVIANMAVAQKIFSKNEFSATVLMVIFTALITPFFLKWSFGRNELSQNMKK